MDKFYRKVKQIAGILIVISFLAPGPVFTRPEPGIFKVTILHTNDFHGADMNLLAKRATVIKQVRALGPNPVLLLDAGDVFTRGPFGKRFYGELEFEIMNRLQYDALTLGNNEFKAANGLLAQQILHERIGQAQFPVLGANVINLKTGDYLSGVSPYVVKDFSGVKIAIIGVTSSFKARSFSQVIGLRVLDPVTVARQMARGLSGKTDIIIALTHIGIDEDLILAEKVPDISLIIGGDSHTILMEPYWIKSCPIVQAGAYGRYIGKLDLTFSKEAGIWKLKNADWELIDLGNSELQPDPDILKIIDRYLKKPQKKAS